MYKREMSGGGAMMDIGIHMTDLVGFIAGEIAEVTAVSSNRVWSVPGSEDDAIAIMRTRTGIPVRYQATWSEWKGYRLSLEAYGDRGMAGAYYAPMMNMTVTTNESRSRRRRRVNLHPWINLREKVRGWQTTATLAFADELADFLGTIAGRPTHIADGIAGLRAVAVARAVEESSARGGAVSVAG
jgi:predicted dehydrogenase